MGHHGNHPNPSNHRDSSGVPDVGKPWLATSDRNSFLAAMVWQSLVNAKPKNPKVWWTHGQILWKKSRKLLSQVGTSIRTTDWKWNHHQDQGKWPTFATTKNSFSPWLNHGFLAERPRVRCNFHSLAAAAHEDEYDDDDNDQDQDDCGEYHGYDDDYDYDILF